MVHREFFSVDAISRLQENNVKFLTVQKHGHLGMSEIVVQQTKN